MAARLLPGLLEAVGHVADERAVQDVRQVRILEEGRQREVSSATPGNAIVDEDELAVVEVAQAITDAQHLDVRLPDQPAEDLVGFGGGLQFWRRVDEGPAAIDENAHRRSAIGCRAEAGSAPGQALGHRPAQRVAIPLIHEHVNALAGGVDQPFKGLQRGPTVNVDLNEDGLQVALAAATEGHVQAVGVERGGWACQWQDEALADEFLADADEDRPGIAGGLGASGEGHRGGLYGRVGDDLLRQDNATGPVAVP